MENPELIATKHAKDRARERFHWNENSLNKMMAMAFEKGITHSKAKGKLKKFIDKLWLDYKQCNNIRIYGENIYFFAANKLITLYRLDNNLIKYLKFSK